MFRRENDNSSPNKMNGNAISAMSVTNKRLKINN